jgi:hypothetical protein
MKAEATGMITVRVGRIIRQFVGDQAKLDVEANSIRQLVDEVDRRYPGFRQEVLTATGQIRSHIEFRVKEGFRYRDRLAVVDLDETLPDPTIIDLDLERPDGG